MMVGKYGPIRKKACLWVFAKNAGADQPVHPHSLIRAVVIQNTISRIATCEISIFYLVSVAEQTGLKLALSETPKTTFGRRGPYKMIIINALAHKI